MMLLDAVGVDPDKIGMKLRVIGEEATIVQALVSGNVDAAVVTLPSAQVAKRGGARTLVSTTDLNIALQTVGLCGRNERIANSPELMTRSPEAWLLVSSIFLIRETKERLAQF